MYSTPGFVDDLGPDLLARWNREIQRQYEQLNNDSNLKSLFFTIEWQSLAAPTEAEISWFGNPAEPEFCLSRLVAKQLSDWGARGRHGVQNEYCEYALVRTTDSSGTLRPKRVQISTELREYWVTLATADPDKVRDMASTVLGFEVAWVDLYGVNNPKDLSEEQRRMAFSTLVAGNGQDPTLPKTVPYDPTGRINTDFCLFMSHPINGLDDLIYIVLFGAKPYAQTMAGNRLQATREQIFRTYGVEHLACRHADPAAAMGACGAAFEGRTVAFKDPIGMYIKSFAREKFHLADGRPIPDKWVRFSRGKNNLWQRLEFGPTDSDPEFLDDIVVSEGAGDSPVTGGYQVIANIEVGPLILVSKPTPLSDADYVDLTSSTEKIKCSEAKVCQKTIIPLKQAYDMEHPQSPPGFRGMR